MILLLGGTGEGKELAVALAKAGVDAVVSLSGATRSPQSLPLEVVTGGFGGASGFVTFLEARAITAIIDATHPFAHRITERTARIAASKGVPYLRLQRPAWSPQTGDRWHEIAREEDMAGLAVAGQTVFLATGRQTLERFANLSECTLICRQIDPPDGPFPFPNGQFQIGRPPFSVEEEISLFQELGVDWLVVKNAGGALSTSKLVAARRLSIPVAMIKRPALPDGIEIVTSLKEALAWTCLT